MGLFDTKYVTSVGTTVSRVIEDDLMPNAVKSGVIKALLQDGNLVDHVLEELIGGIGTKLERMYDYAASNYVYGLPTAALTGAVQGREAVQAVLDGIEGQPVVAEYLHYGTPNYLHVGWTKLLANHGYNPATNQLANLTATLGGPAYLKDMVVIFPNVVNIEKAALEQWGISPKAGYTPQRRANTGPARDLVGYTAPEMDPSATAAPRVRVEYVWVQTAIPPGGVRPIDTFIEGSFLITLDGFDEDADYFHAKYVVGSTTKYWMYRAGAGTYPTLDNVHTQPVETNGTFFPWLYFRYAKQPTNVDKTTAAYKSSKKMAKYLGMDFDQVADAVQENPDVADVEQAMLMPAIPANTTHPLEQRYLFEFFENVINAELLDVSTGRVVGDIREQLNRDLDITKSALFIRDQRFTMALTHGGLYKSRKAGVLGPVGTYSSGSDREFITREFVVYGELGNETTTRDIPVDFHYFRKQVSAGIYEELQVVNLKTRFYVFEQYYSLADDDKEFLLIPLDRSITEAYGVKDREILYARSLHYVFNSRIVTKLSWYQQEWFSDLIIIVAVVITVASFGSDGGSLLGAVLTAVGSEALTTAIVNLIVAILQRVIVSELIQLFVKLVGAEAAFLIAIVAAVSGQIMQLDILSIPGAPWAKDLVNLATNLFSGVNEELSAEFAGLNEEAQEFDLLKTSQTKLLETAQELLEGNNHLLSPYTIFGEKPDDFYNRTVHSGNIGVLSIGAISSYVDIALKLPEIEDTLGGEYV